MARYDAWRDVLELYGATKVPHRNRDALARMLGRSAAAVGAVKEGNTGGGFGVRGELYPEDFLVWLAAIRLGRPIKWIEDRREHLIGANHSRKQHHQVAGCGRCQGQHARALTTSSGSTRAPMSAPTGRACRRGRWMLTGPYRVPPTARSGIPPHQQDAGRDLPRARPLRGHVRARTADGCDRREARP